MAAAPSSAQPPFRLTSNRSPIPASELVGRLNREDRDMLVKMVRRAANRHLANTQMLDEVKEMRSAAAVAEVIGDQETANALGANLRDIAVAATRQSP
jgi:hypothetical protein